MRSIVLGFVLLSCVSAPALAQQSVVRPPVTSIDSSVAQAPTASSRVFKVSDWGGEFAGATFGFVLNGVYQDSQDRAIKMQGGARIDTGVTPQGVRTFVFERGSAINLSGGSAAKPLQAGTYRIAFNVSRATMPGRFELTAGGKTTICTVVVQLLYSGGPVQPCETGDIVVSNGHIDANLQVATDMEGFIAVVPEVVIRRIK